MKNLNSLTMIAIPAALTVDGWDVVSWANGTTLLGRCYYSSKADAATAMEWARDTLTPAGCVVRVEWPN